MTGGTWQWPREPVPCRASPPEPDGRAWAFRFKCGFRSSFFFCFQQKKENLADRAAVRDEGNLLTKFVVAPCFTRSVRQYLI